MSDTSEGPSFLAKNATWILGLLGLAWAVVTYQCQSNKELEQQRLALSHTFREQRLQLYLAAADMVATLATSPPSSEDWKAARRSFYRAYWGRLSVVEDSGVRVAAVNFHDALDRCFVRKEVRNEAAKLSEEFAYASGEGTTAQCSKCLRVLALAISLRARESVSADWDQGLNEVKLNTLDTCAAWARALSTEQ
jgi:hypothetical protein